MCAIIVVLLVPPIKSLRISVNLASLYGTFPELLVRAPITTPKL